MFRDCRQLFNQPILYLTILIFSNMSKSNIRLQNIPEQVNTDR